MPPSAERAIIALSALVAGVTGQRLAVVAVRGFR
jgi:hypothetical protein